MRGGDGGPVFVVGCDRSGTTMLRLMLAATPELHIPAESGFLPELASRADLYGDFTDADARARFIADLKNHPATSKTRAFDVFGLDEAEARDLLSRAAPTDYPGAAAALFTACALREGKPRWGDKTPRNVKHLEWLARAYPEARFIHVIRDPRAVAASLRNAGWVPVPRRGARFWVERVATGRRDGAHLGPSRYAEVHFEDLVTEPEGVLRDLCAFAGLSFVPRTLAFHRDAMERVPTEHEGLFPSLTGPVDPGRAEAWRTELTLREVRQVEGVAGALMERLGYEPETRGMGGAEARFFRLVDALHGAASKVKRRLTTTS